MWWGCLPHRPQTLCVCVWGGAKSSNRSQTQTGCLRLDPRAVWEWLSPQNLDLWVGRTMPQIPGSGEQSA